MPQFQHEQAAADHPAGSRCGAGPDFSRQANRRGHLPAAFSPPLALNIRPGDQVILLGEDSTHQIGPLFAPPALSESKAAAPYFLGEFSVDPASTLEDLAQFYAFPLPQRHSDYAIGDFLHARFHGKPVVGDRVTLGSVQFVVLEIREGRITSVGLKLSQE
ncbi:transporter associated domain-containing protein [Haliea sp. E17]|uniref:transporter associated domain-containing protein n=1 Tax=Haliea sp. E17 TaxID=3401576 RepID=UPI003AABC2CB